MENKLLAKHNKYYLYLIGHKSPISITPEERQNILTFIENKVKYIVIGQQTVMTNGIQAILTYDSCSQGDFDRLIKQSGL